MLDHRDLGLEDFVRLYQSYYGDYDSVQLSDTTVYVYIQNNILHK